MSYFRISSLALKAAAILFISTYGMNASAEVVNTLNPVITVPFSNDSDDSGADAIDQSQSLSDITSAVMDKINQDKDLASLNLKAKVTGVAITLRGTAIAQSSVDAAMTAARSVPGVTSVTSEIIVKQKPQ